MYIMDICIEDVLKELGKNHKVTNKSMVKKAYEYAYQMHKGTTRKTGEPYIMHPLRVANLVASWGFESDIICAALLHDTVEDCDTTLDDLSSMFNSNIANMVDAVTAIDKELKEYANLSKEEVDHLSDIQLQEKMSESALFIKVADRIDNLRTIDGFKEEKKIAKAKHTREIIIPMLMKEEAYQLIDVLEDLCLKIEHPARYNTLNAMYSNLRKRNSFTTDKTLKLFSEVFSPDSPIVSNQYMTLSNSIVKFKCNPRSLVSVYRQVNSQADNISKDLSRLLTKKNIAMYDLTLVISDDFRTNRTGNNSEELTPTNIFFKLYEKYLADKNIYIIDFRHTTYNDSRYYILCDEMDNLYRIFVKSETEYMRYKLGHVIDIEEITDFTIAESDPTAKKIKVFRKDKSSMYIDAGATMLDFAFAIHSEIGLHFDYAFIDDSKTQHHAYERLNEGDTITVITNPEVKPNLQWFKYAKTSKAVEHLIKYLSNK